MRVEDFLIGQDEPIMVALGQLDATAKHCLFAVDERGRLVGSLTDGDVRRLILKRGSIDGTVAEAMNKDVKSATASDAVTPEKVSREYRVQAVPVLSSDGTVSEIVFGDLSILSGTHRLNESMPVVMMAGGKGTRLLPYTAVLPKPLIPIEGKTIAERILERFHEGGCEDFWLVLNYKRNMIKAYFEELDPPYVVHFVDEDEFRGTGGGLKLLEDYIDDTFLLTNCDILVDMHLDSLLSTHRAARNAVTIVCSLKNFSIPYGTIELEAGGGVAAMVEKPTVPSLINTGVYVVEPVIFDFIGEDETVGFPDVIERCMAAGLSVGVFPVSEGSWLDMGQPEELDRMAAAMVVREAGV